MNKNQYLETASTIMGTLHLMMKTIGPDKMKNKNMPLSMHQMRVMFMILDKEGSSLSEISEIMGMTISAGSKLIDALVEHGYINRDTAPNDRRRLILTLTAEGEEVVMNARKQVDSVLASKLSTLTENEIAMVNLSMDILRNALLAPEVKSQ